DLPVRARTDSGDPLCDSCWARPLCIDCGVERLTADDALDGYDDCSRCWHLARLRDEKCRDCGEVLPALHFDAGALRCPSCAPGWFVCEVCIQLRPRHEGCRTCAKRAEQKRKAEKKKRQAPLDDYDDAGLCVVCAAKLPEALRDRRDQRCDSCSTSGGLGRGPQKPPPPPNVPISFKAGLPTLGKRRK